MKYHPIQLNGQVDYTEAPPPIGLQDKIAYYWEIKTNSKHFDYSIIPDGCVDIVVNCSADNQLFITPTLMTVGHVELGKEETWFGVRFYPGSLASLLRTNLSDFHFETVELENINNALNQQLETLLVGTTSFEERINRMNSFLSSKTLHSNNKVLEVINAIYKTKGGILFKEYSSQTFSISERQLRRLFNQEVGLPPKRFASIVRNQFLLNEFKQNKYSKSYYDLYFDQAHMIREMKKLTGLTPNQMILKLTDY